jgi:hypothetical protein
MGFREVLANILYIIPKDILDDVLSNCVFLMVNKKVSSGGIYIPNKVIAKKSIFAFHDMLYSQDKDKQGHMILHEIAHYYLKHVDEGQPEEEERKDEKKANALVDKWNNDWEKHSWKLAAESKKPWKGD